jgi:NADPH-dependent 2,4-dienoyl-CoA reductase/sulfur reductase-like enzyme/rhodanese-related sulfurtransferase
VKPPKRILILGGGAGGASCAARARRLSEDADIVIFERGPYVSFANCGLPYYIGDVIADESKLIIASTDLLKARLNIEVRTETEVVAIDRQSRQLSAKNLKTFDISREPYDALVLAPGAAPVRPALPGIDLPGVFVLRTIPDSRRIKSWIAERGAKSAVVIGAGLVGIEITENLSARGLAVTLIEMMDQVLPLLDPEMAEPVCERLIERDVDVHLEEAVARFDADPDGALTVTTKSGTAMPGDLVIVCVGVRPETTLAKETGLELGGSNSVRVDHEMHTSDPHIWAVGDAAEVRDYITGAPCFAPFAGPANRQGRIAADSIFGRNTSFRGVQSTGVVEAFGLTAAFTGANEKTLKRARITDYAKIYLHPENHAGYFPDARRIHMKLIFSTKDGRILGAQAVGEAGVEKRIDVIASFIQMGGTVFDLEEAELCYAPQYGAAKDPINMAGMMAANFLRGDMPLARWEDVPGTHAFLLDVRDAHEFAGGHVPRAANIPLPQLRERICELPRAREIWLYCDLGQRSYFALRILLQHGFAAKNLPGGFVTYRYLCPQLERMALPAATPL